MLNKILLRKIKFPLSWRGAFSFCHSRGSGNPSSLSLRGAKQACPCESRGSNLNGFSLIELMVAVVILSMAIFGIFNAFNSGWMGMADSRDRTVATNYAQEAMEDVKNMDFEKIITTTKSVTNANKKYRVDVYVSLENPNLKKVFTVVSWKDRNGITKTVDTTMLVQYLEVFASDPAKIVLFAESYAILNTPTDDVYATTGITAVIKDINGNTIIDWGKKTGEGNITFSIISTDNFGTFSNGLTSIEVIPISGRAYTTFTSNGTMVGNFGINVIKASVYLPVAKKIVTDITTIKITNGPVKIKLEADPLAIKASTTNYSTITVSLIDATGQTLMKKDIFTDVEISFSVFGEGHLSTSTITILYNSGDVNPASATIILNSTGNPGLASVVATAADLESGKIDVKFLGPPVTISISASPNPMYFDDAYSTISVSLLDINGFNTNPTNLPITISLALTSNDTGGSLEEPYSWDFPASDSEGIIKETKFSGQLFTGTAIITASGGGLPVASVTINVISAIIPEIIKITASSLNVKAFGNESSTIKATIYDGSGKIVTNYNGDIVFTISNNTSSAYFLTNSTVPVDNGFATIKIVSSNPGNATVNIVNPDPGNLTIEPSEGIVIRFYGDPVRIELTANPIEVYGVETSVITAVIYDNASPANIVTGIPITFTTDKGTFSNGLTEITITPADGVATTELSSSGALGVANIGVSAISISGTFTDSATVTFKEGIDLILVDTPIYNPTNKTVTFNILVTGKSIDIDEMKVSWVNNSASERLSKITMKIPYDAIVEVDVYNGNVKSGDPVDIIDKELTIGKSTIKLTFIKNMLGKTISVVFYPPIMGSYSIEPFLVE